MINRKGWLAASALALVGTFAHAADNLTVKDGNGTLQSSGAKNVGGVLYPEHIMVDSTGVDATDTTNHAVKVNVVAGGGGGAVTNAGTFAVQVTSAPTTAVTGTFFQATQPVSIATMPTTPVTLSGSPTVTVGNIGTISNTSFTATQATGSNLHVVVDTAPTTAVTGSVTATLSGTPTVNNQPVAAASGGATHFRILAPATPAASVIKAGAGQLYSLSGFNNTATVAFLKVYDATSATCGTGTPVETFMLPANSGFVRAVEIGDVFTAGIVACVTGLYADADTTAVTASTIVINGLYK